MASLDWKPWHILTDAKGFESIVESDEDGEPKGDLVCRVFGDHAALLRTAPDMLGLLEEIVAADEASWAELEAMGLTIDHSARALTERARTVIAKAKGLSA